jgi:hypothetical protein
VSLDSDKGLLDAVLARGGRLDQRSREAFEKMQRELPRFGALTLRQRQWLQDEARRIGLDVPPCDRPGPRQSAWEPGPAKGFQKRSRVR